jgi:hypothetical protein
VNLHAHISTLEDFQHVITVNHFFQLLGCPLVADPVRKRAALYQVSGEVSFTVYGVGANKARFPITAALSSSAVPASRALLAKRRTLGSDMSSTKCKLS